VNELKRKTTEEDAVTGIAKGELEIQRLGWS